MVTPDVWEACWLSDQAELGNWPIAGGVLDQSAMFLDVHHLVRVTTHRLLTKRKNA